MDGTIAPLSGNAKAAWLFPTKGSGVMPRWWFLANTKEVLYVINRPGNVASHEVRALDRSGDQVGSADAGQSRLRGDTDFTLSGRIGPLG